MCSMGSNSHGPVSFKLVGSSIPEALEKIKLSPPSRKRKVDRRGNSDELNDALQSEPFSTQNRELCRLTITTILEAFSAFSIGGFNKNISTTLPAINIDKDFTIFSQNLSCSGVTAGLEVDIDTNINAQVTVGVIVQGSLIPPEVSDFAMYAGS